MKKFTQGPWTIGPQSNNLETDIISGKTRIAEVKHYNSGVLDGFVNDPTTEEGKANAKLISKCPDMLEMLEEMLFVLKREEGYDEMYKEVKDLIKEATE